MSWNKIIGHERVKKILQKAIIENRVSHSYCLTGIEGIGKDAIAIQFAKTVNCLNIIKSDSIADSCDYCESCKKFNDLSHQNFEILFSLPAGKSSDAKSDSPFAKLSDEQMSLIISEKKAKAENNYHKIAIPNANQIKVGSIRDIKKKLVLSDSTYGRRVVLISRADEMTTEASNAFLKTLEEPHSNVTIILTTAYHDSILPTIMSRCQHIICSPIDEHKLAEVLVNKHDYSQLDANFASVFGQGSYLRALEALNRNMQDLRKEIIDALRTSLKKTYRYDLVKKLETLLATKDKNKLETLLLILLYWMKDVFALIHSNGAVKIINVDQEESLIKFAKNFQHSDITKAINEIEKAINLIDRNINHFLIFIPLFIKLRSILIAKKV